MQNALAAMSAREWDAHNTFEDPAWAARIFALGTLSDMRALAESGNPRAQYLIGFASSKDWPSYTRRPYGAAQDDAQAIGWWRRAAAAGDLRGINSMFQAYMDGTGVPRNVEEAQRYAAAGAAQGLVRLMWIRGFWLYLNPGLGAPGEGLMWIRRAAAAGDSGSRDFLTRQHIPLQ
jgi:TPR repeat protein